MSLTNQQNIAFSTSYQTDKIVGVYSGSFDTNTAPQLGGYIAYTTVAHGLTRPVFTKLQTSSDGTNWQDGNSANQYAISYSTTTHIYVLSAASVGTIYYRVVAFWIDDYDTTNPLVPPTVGSTSNITFDSRLNYQKVAFQGVLTIPAATLAVTNTITHNLGYKPTVRVYNEMKTGEVWLANYGGGISNYWVYDLAMVEADVSVTDTTLVIDSYGGITSPATRVWYVVYYDG